MILLNSYLLFIYYLFIIYYFIYFLMDTVQCEDPSQRISSSSQGTIVSKHRITKELVWHLLQIGDVQLL